MRPTSSWSSRLRSLLARVERIYANQLPWKWGDQYVPALSDDPSSAPSKSRASSRFAQKVNRRVVAHGRAAKGLTAFALMHPNVWEVQEERVLSPDPRPNPLSLHPDFAALPFPATSGTVEIAQRHGVFKHHPCVWGAPTKLRRRGITKPMWIPIPWIGDLAIYLTDAQGAYPVEWDFKDLAGEHGQPSRWASAGRGRKRASARAEARDIVFRAYMEEMRTPIVRLHRESLPEQLVINANQLFLKHCVPVDLPTVVIQDLIGEFENCLRSGDAPMYVIDSFARRRIKPAAAKLVFEQAVWYRALRVDLYSPLAIDQPVGPEIHDPFVVHASLFRRLSS